MIPSAPPERCCHFAPSVSYYDVHGKTPLCFAAAMGHTSILDLLFNKRKGDFDVNWIDEARARLSRNRIAT